MNHFDEQLSRALAGLEALAPNVPEQLAQHWALVLAWNDRINLTAVTDAEGAAWKHYRDSLEGLRVLPQGPIADLGSGAGFPGVPLAIAQPERQVTLVEPRRKRASFLEVVQARLGLGNVRVLNASSTDPADQEYAAVVTRATFSAEEEIEDCLKWVRPGGLVIAWRSEPSGLPGTAVHPYIIGKHARVLEIWTRS